MHGVLVLVEVGDEVLDAAVVLERRGVASGALVDDRDLQATGQKSGLAQALFERAEVELERLEHVGVGQERHGRASGRAGLELLPLVQLALRGPARVLLRPHVAVAADLDFERCQRLGHQLRRNGSALRAATMKTIPASISGSDSSMPMVSRPHKKPSCASGSRNNSQNERAMP